MITKADGTETLYDLNAVDDVTAWETHEVRHHRRQEQNPIHRVIGMLTMLFAVATLLHAASLPAQARVPEAPQIPLSADKPREVPEVPVVTTDNRPQPQARASRTEARPPQPTVDDRIEQVLAWASAQQDKKYIFGAAGPKAFDCSGLVMQAFAQIGIALPHYTGTMIKYGTKVAQKDLKRGDILFPTSGHVVLYLGNGMQLAASSGKGKVVIQKVYGFYAARRLV